MSVIFITGGSGVLGRALVREWLEFDDSSLRLLVRAGSDEEFKRKTRNLLMEWDDPFIGAAGRIQFLRGDVRRPCFGMDPDAWKNLASEITHIVHAAAEIRLDGARPEARRSSVEGTINVLDLAWSARANGRFRKLEYVSTVGVGGRQREPLAETPLSKARLFHNFYEEAKAEAEQWVWNAIRQGLPATVHRPSMVVGDSRTGRIAAHQVFYHLLEFISGRKTWGVVPDFGDQRLDTVTVDYVAGAIRRSSMDERSAGRVFHLCAGPDRAVRITDLADRYRRGLERSGEIPSGVTPVPAALFRMFVSAGRWFVWGKSRRRLRALSCLLAYLNEDPVFENAGSERYFSEEGFPSRAPGDYLDIVIEAYIRSKTGMLKAYASSTSNR